MVRRTRPGISRFRVRSFHSHPGMTAVVGVALHSIANLHVAAVALAGAALRQCPVLEVAAARDRPAAKRVANDLAGDLRPARAGLGLRPFAHRTIWARVGLMPCGWRFRAPLFAFIVTIEERALRADDFAAAVAVGLEAVLADQRTDPRRLQLDRIERIDACKLDVEFGFGIVVEQGHPALGRSTP